MTPVVYETGTAPFERRIGKRVPTAGLDVRWVEPRWGRPSTEPPREWNGQVDDVSVTGAAIRGPADLPVGPGTKAVVRFSGQDSGVIVRRIEATDEPSVLRYGVELAVVHPTLRSRIFAAVARHDDAGGARSDERS